MQETLVALFWYKSTSLNFLSLSLLSIWLFKPQSEQKCVTCSGYCFFCHYCWHILIVQMNGFLYGNSIYAYILSIFDLVPHPFFSHLSCSHDPFPRPKESIVYSQTIFGFCLFVCFQINVGRYMTLSSWVCFLFLGHSCLFVVGLFVCFQMPGGMRTCLPVTWCFPSFPSCTNTPI